MIIAISEFVQHYLTTNLYIFYEVANFCEGYVSE